MTLRPWKYHENVWNMQTVGFISRQLTFVSEITISYVTVKSSGKFVVTLFTTFYPQPGPQLF